MKDKVYSQRKKADIHIGREVMARIKLPGCPPYDWKAEIETWKRSKLKT